MESEYNIKFERAIHKDVHSQGTKVDDEFYLVGEEGTIPQGEQRKKAFEYLIETIRKQEYPKQGNLLIKLETQ